MPKTCGIMYAESQRGADRSLRPGLHATQVLTARYVDKEQLSLCPLGHDLHSRRVSTQRLKSAQD